MEKQTANQERSRSLFINVTVLLVFVGLMVGFILYLYKAEPDIRRIALESLAEQFGTSVTNAHWQWQAEGRPEMIMLIHYERSLDDDERLVEKDRRPIQMSHLGWPKMQPTSKGCGKLWEMVLNIPLEVDGFRVYPEFYDGIVINDSALTSKCRYRLSTGPYFEYQVYSGQVTKVMAG